MTKLNLITLSFNLPYKFARYLHTIYAIHGKNGALVCSAAEKLDFPSRTLLDSLHGHMCIKDHLSQRAEVMAVKCYCSCQMYCVAEQGSHVPWPHRQCRPVVLASDKPRSSSHSIRRQDSSDMGCSR